MLGDQALVPPPARSPAADRTLLQDPILFSPQNRRLDCDLLLLFCLCIARYWCEYDKLAHKMVVCQRFVPGQNAWWRACQLPKHVPRLDQNRRRACCFSSAHGLPTASGEHWVWHDYTARYMLRDARTRAIGLDQLLHEHNNVALVMQQQHTCMASQACRNKHMMQVVSRRMTGDMGRPPTSA